MNWREFIHGYLKACCADWERTLSKWKQGEGEEGEESVFLHRFGTETFRNRQELYGRELWNSARLQHPDAPVPPERYVLVEESEDRLVADVHGVPYHESERFVLRRDGDSWLISDIYWHCTCGTGRKDCRPGSCWFCNGTGACPACPAPRKPQSLLSRILHLPQLQQSECDFCHGTRRCEYCKGSGRCQHCADSDIPGWTSRFAPPRPKLSE